MSWLLRSCWSGSICWRPCSSCVFSFWSWTSWRIRFSLWNTWPGLRLLQLHQFTGRNWFSHARWNTSTIIRTISSSSGPRRTSWSILHSTSIWRSRTSWTSSSIISHLTILILSRSIGYAASIRTLSIWKARTTWASNSIIGTWSI